MRQSMEGLIIAMLYYTTSLTRIRKSYSMSRTSRLEWSVSHHFILQQLVSFSHYTGYLLRRINFKIALTTQMIRLNRHRQPTLFTEFFTDYRQTHELRSNGNKLFAVPTTKTTKARLATSAFRVAVPTIWNDLPPAIRFSFSIADFQRLLKTFLQNYLQVTILLNCF